MHRYAFYYFIWHQLISSEIPNRKAFVQIPVRFPLLRRETAVCISSHSQERTVLELEFINLWSNIGDDIVTSPESDHKSVIGRIDKIYIATVHTEWNNVKMSHFLTIKCGSMDFAAANLRWKMESRFFWRYHHSTIHTVAMQSTASYSSWFEVMWRIICPPKTYYREWIKSQTFLARQNQIIRETTTRGPNYNEEPTPTRGKVGMTKKKLL